MLEIRDVQYLPDGRSLVDTVGGRRFSVLSRGSRDGYSTARVAWLQDDEPGDADAMLGRCHRLGLGQGSCETWTVGRQCTRPGHAVGYSV